MSRSLAGVVAIDGLGPVTLDRAPFNDRWWHGDLGDLFAWAEEHQVRQVWLAPGALHYFGLPLELEAGEGLHHPFISAPGLQTPKGQVLSSWLSVWKKGGHFLEVSVPSWDRGSPFAGLEFGPLLLGELLEFTEATGMLWKRSGAITSDAYLRDHFTKKVQLQPTNYPEIAGEIVEEDLRYVRAPKEGPKGRAQRLLAFDVNAMYLSAMSSTALPVGGYLEAAGAAKFAFTEGAAPGYWRVGERWMTSPTAILEDLRAVNAGYWWPEHHRYLEPLYRVLRDARTKLLHRPDSAALEAVKQVYRQGIGRLGSTNRSAGLEDVLYQPYWRHAVIAEARSRLLRRIARLGAEPVAVDVDCLYFLTSTKREASAWAALMGLPIDDQIGHFKLAGEAPGKFAREILSGGSIDNNGRRLTGIAALREGVKTWG